MSGAVDDSFDIAIVGAGIVGATIAHFVSPHRRVLLLEGESAPGYHTTGRSAALFTETYGPPGVRALTRASRAFFDRPPEGFTEHPLLSPRGSLLVGGEHQRAEALALQRTLQAEGSAAELVDGKAVRAQVPVLRPGASAVAVADPGAFDIDVHALLQGYLRAARRHGAEILTDGRVAALERKGAAWSIATTDGRRFAAGVVANAAGAWVDEVAALAGVPPIGIEPRRRSAFVFAPPAGLVTAHWPAVVDLAETWYFKPDAGLLLGSPANADLVPPHDVVAEELDIAIGIDRIQTATTMSIRRPQRTWAGLRCFVADGEPVCGFDPAVPGFFWAAALGGYGIQSSPGFGLLAAALLRGEPVPESIARQRLILETLLPRHASLRPTPRSAR